METYHTAAVYLLEKLIETMNGEVRISKGFADFAAIFLHLHPLYLALLPDKLQLQAEPLHPLVQKRSFHPIFETLWSIQIVDLKT